MSDEFKETPIGKIPKDWDVKPLKEVVMFRRKNSSKLKEVSQVAFIPMGLVPDEGFFAKYELRPVENVGGSSTYCEPGDILLAKITPSFENGKQGIVPFDAPNGFALATTEVYPLVPTEEIDRMFLFYLLKYPKNRKLLESKMRGTTGRQRVPKDELSNLLLPLPPLPEQKKIAEILSTIDKAIEKTDALIHHYQQLKNALMQKLFTEGIGHTRFKPSPLGQIPAEWDVVKIGDIIEFAQYGLSIKMYDEGQYPIVKMDSIFNGKVMPVNLKYVDLDEETFNKFKLEKGDVLVNRTNSYELVGKTGIFLLEGDYVFASYLIRLRPKKDIVDSAFLTYYLILSQDRLRQIATRGVSQANINATNLKKFLVPLPPLEEQKKIAQILMTIDNKIDAEMKTKEELEKLKQGMMDKLLTGKVRVKVGEGSG